MLSLNGTWIVELPELAALRKSQLETWKAFLTRATDRYRPPFARRDMKIPEVLRIHCDDQRKPVPPRSNRQPTLLASAVRPD